MEKLKNKNTIVLIISAILIVIAIVIAVVASTSSSKPNDETQKESVSLNTDLIASLKDDNSSDKDTASDTKSSSSSKQDKADASYTYEPGKYTVATKDDPLGLRIEPNTSSDKIIYIPKGEQVEVIAIWEDWGYVVYEKTGGWLSMNYLELVSGKSSNN